MIDGRRRNVEKVMLPSFKMVLGQLYYGGKSWRCQTKTLSMASILVCRRYEYMGANDVEVLYPIHQKVILVEENPRRNRLCPRREEAKDISAGLVIR